MRNLVFILLLVVPVLLHSGTTLSADTVKGQQLSGSNDITGIDVSIENVLEENALDIAHDNDDYDAQHGHDHAHGEKAGLPQMDPTWFASQLFWLAIMFTFLYVVFAKSVLPALSETIDGRRNHIENDLETARRLKDEAEKIHNEYETAINKARETATQSYTAMENDIKVTSETRLATLSQTTAQTIKDADIDIQKAKDTAINDVFDSTADMVALAAEKLTGVKTDVKTARDVINELTKTLTKKAA